jgi:hypothetical protein
MERLKNETIKEAVTLESKAASADSMAVSFNLFLPMDAAATALFTPERSAAGTKYRLYYVGTEK